MHQLTQDKSQSTECLKLQFERPLSQSVTQTLV